jgi:FtsP/CotA-like multicopper oxidase with cupredoxin domain
MGKYIRIAVVVAVAVSGAVMLPRIVSSREAVRDVTVVVRNMAYYVDGENTPNPALRFAAGEQVRLTLRNEDRGMSHDFSVKSWGVATKVLDGKGQDTVTFRVPRSNASTSYTCTPHTAMMNGAIVIE